MLSMERSQPVLPEAAREEVFWELQCVAWRGNGIRLLLRCGCGPACCKPPHIWQWHWVNWYEHSIQILSTDFWEEYSTCCSRIIITATWTCEHFNLSYSLRQMLVVSCVYYKRCTEDYCALCHRYQLIVIEYGVECITLKQGLNLSTDIQRQALVLLILFQSMYPGMWDWNTVGNWLVQEMYWEVSCSCNTCQ